MTASGVDDDGDGYTVGNGDCDDTDASIHPGATEICDGVNNAVPSEVITLNIEEFGRQIIFGVTLLVLMLAYGRAKKLRA